MYHCRRINLCIFPEKSYKVESNKVESNKVIKLKGDFFLNFIVTKLNYMFRYFLFIWIILIPAFEATVLRIQEAPTEILGFERFVESKNYFKDASAFELLIGKGFAGIERQNRIRT